MGLGTALAIQAGSTLAGTLANEFLNPEPEIPNLSAEALTEFNERRRDLAEVIDRREREMEADLAASGKTGSAGAISRQRIASEFADAQADIASDAAKTVAEAEQLEEQLRFDREAREQSQRAQGIADLVGGVGQTLAVSQLEGDEQTEDEDEAGGTLLDPQPRGEQDGFTAASLANTGRELLENRFGIPVFRA